MTRPVARPVLRLEPLEGRLPPAAHTLDAAEPLALGPVDTAGAAGFLAAPDQYDLYRVELGRGDTLRAAVAAQLAGSGLQPLLRVFDDRGREVGLNDQEGGDPELTVQAPAAGTYFVGVSAAGNADYDPKSASGGTPGSTTGTYSLAVSVHKNRPLAAALAASSFRLSAPTAAWGETVQAALAVENRGGAAAGAFTVQVYASPDPRFDPAASVPLLPMPVAVPGLAAGARWAATGLAVTLPEGFPAFASAPTDLFPDLGLLASGPIYLGLRVTPADPAEGGATIDPAGGVRGAGWEELTVVVPRNESGPAQAAAAGSLTRGSNVNYKFTVSPAVGAVVFTATVGLDRPGVAPSLVLVGSPTGQSSFRVQADGTADRPTATLSQLLQPGTYRLEVFLPLPDVLLNPEERAVAWNFQLGASALDASLNTRTVGALGAGQAERYPVTVAAAGQLTAELVTTGAVGTAGMVPRLALYAGAAGEVLVFRTQGPAEDPVARLTQYLDPGVYFLEVSGTPAGAYRLTTTFTAADAALDGVPTRGTTGAVAAGDFDNDGRLDLVVLERNLPPGQGNMTSPNSDLLSFAVGRFSVRSGNGDGTYGPPLAVATQDGDPRAVAVADLNGDGNADVVVGFAKNTGVAAYLGNGDGTFQAPRVVPTGDRVDAVAVAVADLNGDGIPDLVVADAADDSVRAYLGDGAGGFRPAARVPVLSAPRTSSGPGIKSLAVADLDGDGRPDVAATVADGVGTFARDITATGGGAVAVMFGRGDGTFRRGPDLADGGGPGAVAAADLNGDGNPDVVVANVGTESVGVFLGDGGGRFRPMTSTPAGARPLTLVAADVNGDGLPDLVATGDGVATTLLGNGRGGFVVPLPAYPTGLSGAGLAVADVDRDGTPDLLVTADGITVLPGRGDGTFQTRPAVARAVDGAPVALAVADFNGDGRPDVATTLARDPAVAVMLGNGDGTYGPQAEIPVGDKPAALASADLNRDGRADLVVADYGDGTVGVLLGNGDGTFRPQVTYPAGVGPCALVLADVNHDGNPDVVVANNGDGTVVTLLGAGDGTLRDTRAGPLAASPGSTLGPGGGAFRTADGDLNLTGLVGLAAGDLNGDRHADVVFVDDRAGTLGVRLGRGDGTFGPTATIPLRLVAAAVTVADVDGDGTADVVLTNPDAQTVGVLRGLGDGTLAPTEQTVVIDRPAPAPVAVADVNGDGRADLLVTNEGADTVSVLLGDGAGGFQALQAVPAGAVPRVVAAADVNADGKPDALVLNGGTARSLTTLLGRGDGTFVTATELGGVGRTNTPLLAPLAGAVDAAGRPVLDSVVLDDAGNLLFRPGQAGGNGFGAPVTLNPGRPVRDAVPLQTPTGWVIAAVERVGTPDAAPVPGLENAPRLYTVLFYSVAGGKPAVVGSATSFLLPTRVYAADLTGSGRAEDLVFLNALDDSIQVVLRTPGAATAPYGVPLTLPAGATPSGATFADLDGDGLTDIAVSNQVSNDVSVFLNGPDHRFATSRRVRGGQNPPAVATTSAVSTVLGGAARTGDGGPATASPLNDPAALTVDGAGDVYFADNVQRVVRRVDAATGVITTVAGNWTLGTGGDGGPATSAAVGDVVSLAVDASGNVFVTADEERTLSGAVFFQRTVRRVDAATGLITAVPDGDPVPAGRTTDDAGNRYSLADNQVVRTDARTGAVSAVAGAPAPRTIGQIGLGVAGLGDLYFSNPDAIFRQDGATGVISTVVDAAGTVHPAHPVPGSPAGGVVGPGLGLPGGGAGGPPAAPVPLGRVDALTVGLDGNLYFSDRVGNVVRRVDLFTGAAATVGALPFDLNEDYLAADVLGNVYVAHDTTIYRVDGRTGAVAVLATRQRLTPDRGHQDEATGYPTPLALDRTGGLYFADGTTVRRVDLFTGADATVAGTGGYGTLGDGGPAAAAQLRYVRGLAADAAGNLFVTDSQNLIREVVAATGVITPVYDLGGAFDTFGGITGTAVDGNGDILVKGPARVSTPIGPRLVSEVLKVTAPRTAVASLGQAVGLVAGNFTGDGRPDLLVVNRGAHAFSVLPGDGGGGFAAPAAALATSTSDGRKVNADPGAAVAGRFRKGATVDDAAVLMRDAGEVWVFTNAGDGTFRHTQTVRVGAGATGLSVAPGAGGALDLLVGNGAGDVLRLVGDGAGRFAPPPPVTGTRAPIAVQTAGGAPVALVANQQTNRVTVQTQAAGSFTPVGTLTADAGVQLAPGDVTWYPLSKAGAPADAVVLASGSNTLLVYRATGTGAGGTPTFAAPVGYPTGTNPVHLTVADVNGDAIPDMLVANAGSNDVSVLFGGYGAGGRWVGTPGPRLRAAGAGPLSADLVADPASPGGNDLAVTTRDGRVSVLAGRGGGFFDDAHPRVFDLGTPLAPQAPSFIPGLPVGYAATADGAVIRFDAAAGGQTTVSSGQGVLLVQAVDSARVVVVRGDGGVVLASAGGFTDLLPRGGEPAVPGSLAVLDLGAGALEVLLTGAGSESVYEYAARATSDGTGEPVTFEVTSDLTSLDSSGQLVPTLVTTLTTGGGGGPRLAATAAGFNPLDATGLGLSAGLLARLAGKRDDELVSGDDESLLAALAPVLFGGSGPEPADAPGRPAATTRDELLDAAAGALERLVEAARKGPRPDDTPGAPPADVAPLVERLLELLRNLPGDSAPANPPLKESGRGDARPDAPPEVERERGGRLDVPASDEARRDEQNRTEELPSAAAETASALAELLERVAAVELPGGGRAADLGAVVLALWALRPPARAAGAPTRARRERG